MPEEPIDDSAPDTGAPPSDAPTAEDLQQQIADLREQVAEGQRTAQFWADKAKAAPAPPAVTAPAGDEEEPDVLEAITTKGAKGFDDLAAKRGFVRRTEVEALIDAKASALTKEQQLMDEYPDLKNRNSEFFKTTAMYYGDLTKNQGVPAQAAMEMAARRTELDMLRAGKGPANGNGAGKDDKEARRLARIAAQSPAGGGRRPAAPSEEDDNELTAEQKHIAQAMGITEEAYAKRAKAGVAMSSGRGR